MVRVASTLLLLALAGTVSAQVSDAPAAAPASVPENRPVVTADRAADEGLQKLLDAVAGLQTISDGVSQPVASLLAFTPDGELELRQLIAAAVQVGRPRQSRPGVTAVEVSITTERLNDFLLAALNNHPGTHVARHATIASSVGPAVVVTGLAADDGLARDTRPGWRHCTSKDMGLSVKAAQFDLRQQLLAWLQRVPLSSGQTLGQLSRQHPKVADALAIQAERIVADNPVFESSGTCVVSCTLRPEQLTSLVGLAIRQAETPAEGVKPQAPFEVITIRGFSVASPQLISNRATIASGPRPEWAARTISKTATASGATNEPDAAGRNELAIRAARVEAQRELWLELEQLVLPSGRTVADAIIARPDRDSIIQTISAAVFEMSKASVDSNGVAKITLGIRLESVWQAVGR